MTPRTLRRHHRAALDLAQELASRTGTACRVNPGPVLMGLEGWCITPRKITSPAPADLRAAWAEACDHAQGYGLPPVLMIRGHRRAWRALWSVSGPRGWGDYGLTVAGALDAWLCGARVGL